MSTAIVWFRGDLRMADNPALTLACFRHSRVLPLYIHAPELEAPWEPGAASRWWLHHSLEALQGELEESGATLLLQQGDPLSILEALAARYRIDAVYWNRQYEPAAVTRDARVKKGLRKLGLAVHSQPGNLWREPWEVATKSGEPYRVFTPFWRNIRASLDAASPLPVPELRDWLKVDSSMTLSDLHLLPRIPWDTGLEAAWRPGSAGAGESLAQFCEDALSGYATLRDIPGQPGTSRLSPHLHFGEITPRQIHAQLLRHAGASSPHPNIEPYLRELGWREFAHHLLYHFPDSTRTSFNPRFAKFQWEDNAEWVARWCRGETGIPLVDAGMRELWHTGWMHNRVRMVVASFLTKNLRQHWHHGARWFWDTLVDADLANNSLGWQWVAGTGADAAPYFRVFNPVTQAKKFDPDGHYLRRWLPELAAQPVELLHEPWKNASLIRNAKYPKPIVDLGQSRVRALAAYQAMGTT